MNLRPTAVSGEPQLAGRWQLKAPQRETLADTYRKMLEQTQEKQEENFRKQRQRMQEHETDIRWPDEDAPPVKDGEEGAHKNEVRRSNWRMREQRDQNEALLNTVLPHAQLQISQTPQRIEFVPDRGARRGFDVGQTSTLVSNYSTLYIESGWQANEFVVHSRDREQGIDIVERYQRTGDALQLQVQFKSADIKKQMFIATYTLLH